MPAAITDLELVRARRSLGQPIERAAFDAVTALHRMLDIASQLASQDLSPAMRRAKQADLERHLRTAVIKCDTFIGSV